MQAEVQTEKYLAKWIAAVVLFMGLSAACVGLFNLLTDPFGVFGDRLLNWYAFDMTNNPRVAKIAYLDARHETYDSYIIGCSKTSAFSTELLNKYYNGANFYNMIMYGGDMFDIKMTAAYVMDHYNPKNIIIALGLEEAVNYNSTKGEIKQTLHAKAARKPLVPFYFRFLFLNPQYGIDKLSAIPGRSLLPRAVDVFDPLTGVYNKAKRDAERISGLEEFLAVNPNFEYDLSDKKMTNAVRSAADIGEIRRRCEREGVDFKLILTPIYYKEANNYQYDEILAYWKELALASPFWDFSGYSEISFDERYFYDAYHFRNSVGDMVLARIFGDDSIFIPNDFGRYVTTENAAEAVEAGFKSKAAIEKASYTKSIPVLLYHDINEEPMEYAAVTPERFRNDMRALVESGYKSLYFKDLEDYVIRGKELPEKSVIITFDDGYRSNLAIAGDILDDAGLTATVNIIGMSVGKEVYKDTDDKIIPHFSYAEARHAYIKGSFDFQSHSYAMHDSKALEPAGIYREGVLPKKGEGERVYIDVFREDVLKSKKSIEEGVGNRVFVYAYPLGFYSDLTESLLRDMGFTVTLSIDPGQNVLIKGLPQSLLALRRINVTMESPDVLTLIAGN